MCVCVCVCGVCVCVCVCGVFQIRQRFGPGETMLTEGLTRVLHVSLHTSGLFALSSFFFFFFRWFTTSRAWPRLDDEDGGDRMVK